MANRLDTTIRIQKGRSKVVAVQMTGDVSSYTFAAEIREERDGDSELVATWTIDDTDANVGRVVLSLDNSDTADITVTDGWTDMMKTVGGVTTPVFDPIPVVITNPVTQP